MLPAVRRVVSTTANHSPAASPLLYGLSAPRTVTTAAVFAGRPPQQRRYSSSKPSSSNSGPKALRAAGPNQSVPAGSQSAKSTGDGKAGSEKRGKRKSNKDNADKAKLPSVPSTQHLPQEALALSDFFSLHRPISITHSLPRAVTGDAFASIFRPRTRGQKNADVISTLSRSVDDLERPMFDLGLDNQDPRSPHEGGQRIDLQHPDGTESSVYVQLDSMAGQFLPFTPPAAPQPASDNAAENSDANAHDAAAVAAEEDEAASHHRVYKAMFTIEESTDQDGQVKIMAHSPQIVEEQQKQQQQRRSLAAVDGDQPRRTHRERLQARSLLGSPALREMRYEDGASHVADEMVAISVRRQRKLKMKKKKYKKLMKRTRNLRRKLDRT